MDSILAAFTFVLLAWGTDRGQRSEQPAHAITKHCLSSLGYLFGRAADKKTHPREYESEKTPTKHKIYMLRHAPKKEWGGCWHGPLTANSKHTCTQQADQSTAQHNKSKPSPAQPSQGKQSRSSAKPKQAKHASKQCKTHMRPKILIHQIGFSDLAPPHS